MYQTQYKRAGSLDEANALVGASGGEGKYLSGGMTLIPTMKARLASPSALIDCVTSPISRDLRRGTARAHRRRRHHAEVAASKEIERSARPSASLPTSSAIPPCAHMARSAASSPTSTRRPTIRRRCWRSAARSTPTGARSGRTTSFSACSRRALEEDEIVTGVSFEAPDAAGWGEVPQPRLALCHVRRLRRPARQRDPRRRDGRRLQRRLPLARGRGGLSSARFEPEALDGSRSTRAR